MMLGVQGMRLGSKAVNGRRCVPSIDPPHENDLNGMR